MFAVDPATAVPGARVLVTHVVRATDGLTTSVQQFALPMMIFTATGSATWSGVAFVVEWLPRLCAIPMSGLRVDRHGPRRVLIITNLARCGVTVVALVWLLADPGAWAALIGLAIIVGLLAECSYVASEAAGAEVTDRAAAHRVQSTQAGIDQTVLVIGPPTAALVLMTTGSTGVLLGSAILGALVPVLAVTLPVAAPVTPRWNADAVSEPVSVSMRDGVRTGLRVVTRNRLLSCVVIVAAAQNLMLAVLLAATPAMALGRYGMRESTVGLMWTCGAIGSLAAIVVARRAIGRNGRLWHVGLVSSLLAGFATVTAGTASSGPLFFAGVALLVTADGAGAVYLRTARTQVIPPDVFGVTISVVVLLVLVPYPFAGALVAVVPREHLSSLITVCGLVATAVAASAVMRVRREPGRHRRPTRRHRPQDGPLPTLAPRATAPVAALPDPSRSVPHM
ncbi:MFS transporter [Streptomycetaceae bacterium NBC_01309]